jgi:hydrogenase nickel incorporation protein HypA/HybF
MHEMSLVNGLIQKLEFIARDERARRIVRLKVKLGALSHMSKDHFQEHFERATRGTVAEGASLDVEELLDIHDAHAQDIILESVDIERGEENRC